MKRQRMDLAVYRFILMFTISIHVVFFHSFKFKEREREGQGKCEEERNEKEEKVN